MILMKNILVISIKPEYMNLILAGVKSIELRKCRPIIPKDDILVALYSTAPVKAVVGFCLLDELIEDNPTSLWSRFSDCVGIDKDTFFEYYSNHGKAFGLRLENVYVLKESLGLEEIKAQLPGFTPPQTYKYYNLKYVETRFKERLNSEYHQLRKGITRKTSVNRAKI